MGLLKSKVKIGTVTELGNSLDDAKEECEKDALRAEGYEAALKDLEKGLKSLFEKVDAERDEGTYDELGNPLEIAGLAKKALTRVAGSIDNLRVRNEKAKLIREGKIKGLEVGIKRAKKIYDSELRKLEAIQAGLRDGTMTVEDGGVLRQSDIQNRPSGAHPGNPLADLKDREVGEPEAKKNGQTGPAVAKKKVKKKAKKVSKRSRRPRGKPKEADATDA